jgi:eukaryotic-like serine/threonine-protein kinase
LRDGPMALPRVMHVGAQTADGLAAAHERGIIHGDVKPENLMVTPDWRVKILDFGLAKLLDPAVAPADVEPADGDSTTRPGAILGTAGYMAPEQARGQPADARSDIFALGCVLYEMSFGERAFQGQSPLDTLAMILSADPPLAADGREIPPELGQALRRCLDKDPARRYQSAHNLAADLRALASGRLPPTLPKAHGSG